ncbi:MAG: TetR/AcrR family transcriptional regulator [bacterium]
MPGIKQSPKLPAETRRNQLLGAAQTLFIRNGYRATSIESIARRAGLTKGAFYYHFRSKEEILCRLLQRMADQFSTAFESETDRDLSPGYVLNLLRNIDLCRNMPRTRHSLDLQAEVLKLPRIRAHINKVFRKAIDVVAARLDPSFGRTLQQRRQLAVLIFSLYDGLALRKYMSPKLVDVDRQVRLFSSLLQQPRSGKLTAGRRSSR